MIAAPPGNPGLDRDEARRRALDETVSSLYATISGPAGQKRDLTRLKAMLHPEAMHAFVHAAPGEAPRLRSFKLEDFLAFTTPIWERGFYEREIARRVDHFSNFAQVFSTYEVRLLAEGPVVRRGINGFQFFFDGKRWLLWSALWEGESEGSPIPSGYLHSPSGQPVSK